MHALNPKTENLKPLRPFLDLAPLRILGLLLDVKAEVCVCPPLLLMSTVRLSLLLRLTTCALCAR
jgi:hypothetical protein